MAVGTVVKGAVTRHKVLGVNRVVAVPIHCVASSSDGSFPATAIDLSAYHGWYLQEVITNPGATAPQAAYDITLVDADGFDRALGLLADRNAANTEVVQIAGTNNNRVLVLSNLTLTIVNNNVNSAIVDVTLVLVAE